MRYGCWWICSSADSPGIHGFRVDYIRTICSGLLLTTNALCCMWNKWTSSLYMKYVGILIVICSWVVAEHLLACWETREIVKENVCKWLKNMYYCAQWNLWRARKDCIILIFGSVSSSIPAQWFDECQFRPTLFTNINVLSSVFIYSTTQPKSKTPISILLFVLSVWNSFL